MIRLRNTLFSAETQSLKCKHFTFVFEILLGSEQLEKKNFIFCLHMEERATIIDKNV